METYEMTHNHFEPRISKKVEMLLAVELTT